MTDAATRPPPPPALPPPARRRGPSEPSTQGPPVRRRWGRFAAGAGLALLGGWISASLYVSAGSRVGVLVAANEIGAYEEISREDLRTVRVAADPGVETVSAGDADELVGRIAATDIPRGTLLSPGHLFAEDQRLVASDEATVGAALGPGEAPPDLRSGDDVLVVVPPPQGGSDAGVQQVDGWIRRVGEVDDQDDTRQVEIVVPAASAADVAAASDRLRVVALAGG